MGSKVSEVRDQDLQEATYRYSWDSEVAPWDQRWPDPMGNLLDWASEVEIRDNRVVRIQELA